MIDPGIEQVVVAKEHEVWKAVLEQNAKALDDLFAEDYVEITLEGLRVFKEAIVETSPEVDRIRGYAIQAVHCVPISDHAVLLSYHLRIEGESRGKPVTPPDRWASSLWVRCGGSWQCKLFQQSHYQRPALDS